MCSTITLVYYHTKGSVSCYRVARKVFISFCICILSHIKDHSIIDLKVNGYRAVSIVNSTDLYIVEFTAIKDGIIYGLIDLYNFLTTLIFLKLYLTRIDTDKISFCTGGYKCRGNSLCYGKSIPGILFINLILEAQNISISYFHCVYCF